MSSLFGSTMHGNEKLGELLSEFRKQKELTLQQLADSVGVTPAYISQIEHGKVSPSLANLRKLAKALDRRMVDFFIDELIDDPVVLPEGEWTEVRLPRWSARVRQMVRIAGNKKMQPFYTVIEPGGGTRDDYSHPGEEFGLVLKGEMTLKVGEEVLIVKAMSSFYYSSLAPHSWTNEGDDPCCVVWVISPPSW
ncbi:MAG: XRE family transcriptional regulator [Pseudomonadota bacterium]